MEDEEYMKQVRENFYKQVRRTRWGDDEERPPTTKGRKPKPYVRPEAKPRSVGEHKAVGSNPNNKWFNY